MEGPEPGSRFNNANPSGLLAAHLIKHLSDWGVEDD